MCKLDCQILRYGHFKILAQACPSFFLASKLLIENNFIDVFKKWAIDASKHVVVHLEFFSKSDHKILSYGHFKIIAQESTQWGEGIDPKLKL